MSYRFRAEAYPQRPSPTRQARNVMLAALITFLVVTALVLIAGDFPATSEPLVIGGTTYVDYTSESESLLGSYGWVDRQAGQVHIPIDQAMDLVVERGLPTRAVTPDGAGGQ